MLDTIPKGRWIGPCCDEKRTHGNVKVTSRKRRKKEKRKGREVKIQPKSKELCDRGYHTYCLTPEIKTVPKRLWQGPRRQEEPRKPAKKLKKSKRKKASTSSKVKRNRSKSTSNAKKT
ncbi:hypothetical protein AAMO2058_000537700 [Amorphochlora amoebiformis]